MPALNIEGYATLLIIDQNNVEQSQPRFAYCCYLLSMEFRNNGYSDHPGMARGSGIPCGRASDETSLSRHLSQPLVQTEAAAERLAFTSEADSRATEKPSLSLSLQPRSTLSLRKLLSSLMCLCAWLLSQWKQLTFKLILIAMAKQPVLAAILDQSVYTSCVGGNHWEEDH